MTLSIGSSGTVSPTPSGVASAARDDTADVVACCRSGQGLAALLTQPQQERQVAELDMAQLCRALYELQKLLYRDDERPAADPLPLLRLLARRGVALLGDDRETRHRDDRSWKEYGNAFKDAVRLAIVYPELQGCDSWQALELGYLKRALRCNEYQTRGMINDFFQRLTVDELMSISHEMQSFCDVEVLSCLPTKLQEARRGNSDPFALWLKLNPIIEDMRWDTKMKHNFMGELVKQIASLPAERLLAVSEEQLTVFLSTMPLFNTQWTSYQGHLESIIDNLIDCGRALSEREVVLLLFNVDIPKYRDEDKRRWIPPLTDKFIALFADGALPSITSSKKVASALYHQHNNNYCPDKTMEAIRLLIKAVSSNDEPLGTDLKYLISLFMMSTIFKESDQHYLTKLVDAICCCRPQYYRSHERENRTNTINLTQLTFLLPFAHVAIKCYGTKARLYNWAIDNLEQIPLGQCDITKAGVLLSVPTIVKLDAARAEQYHRKVVHKLSNGQWDSGSGRKTQYLELSLVLEAEPPPAVKEVYSKKAERFLKDLSKIFVGRDNLIWTRKGLTIYLVCHKYGISLPFDAILERVLSSLRKNISNIRINELMYQFNWFAIAGNKPLARELYQMVGDNLRSLDWHEDVTFTEHPDSVYRTFGPLLRCDFEGREQIIDTLIENLAHADIAALLHEDTRVHILTDIDHPALSARQRTLIRQATALPPLPEDTSLSLTFCETLRQCGKAIAEMMGEKIVCHKMAQSGGLYRAVSLDDEALAFLERQYYGLVEEPLSAAERQALDHFFVEILRHGLHVCLPAGQTIADLDLSPCHPFSGVLLRSLNETPSEELLPASHESEVLRHLVMTALRWRLGTMEQWLGRASYQPIGHRIIDTLCVDKGAGEDEAVILQQEKLYFNSRYWPMALRGGDNVAQLQTRMAALCGPQGYSVAPPHRVTLNQGGFSHFWKHLQEDGLRYGDATPFLLVRAGDVHASAAPAGTTGGRQTLPNTLFGLPSFLETLLTINADGTLLEALSRSGVTALQRKKNTITLKRFLDNPTPGTVKLSQQLATLPVAAAGTWEDPDLKGYQAHSVQKALDHYDAGSGGFLLALEMGLGKTITMAKTAQQIIERELLRGRPAQILVVVTASTKQQTIQAFRQQLTQQLEQTEPGARRRRLAMLQHNCQALTFDSNGQIDEAPPADEGALLFINGEQLTDEAKGRSLSALPLAAIFFDEAHTLQNTSNNLFLSFEKMVAACREQRAGSRGPFLLFSTGSPLSNSLEDLLAYLRLIEDNVPVAGGEGVRQLFAHLSKQLNGATNRLYTFCSKWHDFNDAKKLAASSTLYEESKRAFMLLSRFLSLVDDFSVRYTSGDDAVVQAWPGRIPALTIDKVTVPLSERQVRQLRRLDDAYGARHDGKEKNYFKYYQDYTKLTLHPSQADGEEVDISGMDEEGLTDFIGLSGPMHHLFSTGLVQEHANGGVLLFVNQIKHGELLQELVKKVCSIEEVRFFHGSLSESRRNEIRNWFNDGRGQPRVLAITKEAGGVGINFDKNGQLAVFFREEFNPQDDLQARGRLFRVNSDKPEVRIVFYCNNTLQEQRVDYYASSKRRLEGLAFGRAGRSDAQLFEQMVQCLCENTDFETYRHYDAPQRRPLRNALTEALLGYMRADPFFADTAAAPPAADDAVSSTTTGKRSRADDDDDALLPPLRRRRLDGGERLWHDLAGGAYRCVPVGDLGAAIAAAALLYRTEELRRLLSGLTDEDIRTLRGGAAAGVPQTAVLGQLDERLFQPVARARLSEKEAKDLAKRKGFAVTVWDQQRTPVSEENRQATKKLHLLRRGDGRYDVLVPADDA